MVNDKYNINNWNDPVPRVPWPDGLAFAYRGNSEKSTNPGYMYTPRFPILLN